MENRPSIPDGDKLELSEEQKRIIQELQRKLDEEKEERAKTAEDPDNPLLKELKASGGSDLSSDGK